MKKVIIVLLVLIFTSGDFIYSQKLSRPNLEKYSRVSFQIRVVGDILAGVKENLTGLPVPFASRIIKELKTNKKEASVSDNTQFVFTGATTIFDLVSNSTPNNICQNPDNNLLIHSALMCSPPGDPSGFPGRRTKYYYSWSTGTNWTYVTDCPSTRSGFPVITLLADIADARDFITNYGKVGGSQADPCFYIDNLSGSGTFTLFEHPSYAPYLYPKITSTYSVTIQNKLVALACNNSSPDDSLFYTIWLSANPPPGSFTPWTYVGPSSFERYQIARGSDGRIGIVYIVRRSNNPVDYGSVFFTESTNNGTSFNTPIKIYNANFNTDSLGAFQGISLVYLGNSPKVVFETVKQKTNGSYFPGAPAKIRFWSNSLPGIDPNRSIKLADSNDVGYHPYISTGAISDLFAPLCRPTIGVSGSVMFVSFMVPSNLIGGSHDTCSYMDIWMAISGNGGISWGLYSKINPVSPVYDWSYPCISPKNDTSSNYSYYANMMVLRDSVPGTYVNHPLNGLSNAKYYFLRFLKLGIIENPPEIPVLISPANGATNVSLTPTMSWTSTGYTYRLQISQDSTFANAVFDTLISSTNCGIHSGLLNINTSYFWKVKAFVSAYESGWTSPWKFTTRETGIRIISPEIPNETKLFQNYPNPFNPVTCINYQVSKSSIVKLIIYDILGKEVLTLINENQKPGIYEIRFNGEGLSSRIHFYKLTAGNYSSVKRMIMIK